MRTAKRRLYTLEDGLIPIVPILERVVKEISEASQTQTISRSHEQA
jgi:hypothetical protein